VALPSGCHRLGGDWLRQGNAAVVQVLPRLLKIDLFVMGGKMVEVGADDVCALSDDIGHDLFFIIGCGFPFLDVDGPQRAGADTGAQAVAKKIGYQPGLAVDKLQGSFGAIGQTLSATVADILVDADYFSLHVNFLLARG
jgi:hypothetical protein